ncbi:Charged multivesicular body protein 6 [Zalerion maritima]|uniref:Charged multivesicular body protein 6 n=1 Tax=Zalerion maritima TaxID=339359 RepID=A0AAD5WRN7_9PEZI|nr:Charged multivesicular body protein 6 [Zalerion maritima]
MGQKQSRVTEQDKLVPSVFSFLFLSRLLSLHPTTMTAILDLKLQRDKLHQYQRKVVVLTTRETEIAKELLSQGDKTRALLALRRKKYQETLLQKTDAQLEQLEKLVSSVEFAMIQKDVVFGLQQGTSVLKEIHIEMGGIEHVEKLMGENADAVAYQEEISDMLGGRISVADEEEVEDELAALEAETKIPSLPNNVPDGLPKAQEGKTPAATQEAIPEVHEPDERQAVPA